MEAVDCAVCLDAQTAAALKGAGIAAVGRYLGFKTQGWSKALSPAEIQELHNAGLAAFLIWESNPTTSGYFYYDRGLNDAQLAAEEAAFLGAPSRTAIYFTVDFDAQPQDMAEIIAYFEGVRAGLAGRYPVGAYGSFAVLAALQGSAFAPDKYFQTYAWSGGSVFQSAHIYQYQNDLTLAGMQVDRDSILSQPGAWPEVSGGTSVNNAVLAFGPDDAVTARRMAESLGNCAIFFRKSDGSAPADVKLAKTLHIVGGASVGHPNEKIYSGATYFRTVDAVGKALGQ